MDTQPVPGPDFEPEPDPAPNPDPDPEPDPNQVDTQLYLFHASRPEERVRNVLLEP